MTIDTIKETFNVGIDKSSAKAVNAKVLEILHAHKGKANKSTESSTPANSSADEILKFKQLADAGVIMQVNSKQRKSSCSACK